MRVTWEQTPEEKAAQLRSQNRQGLLLLVVALCGMGYMKAEQWGYVEQAKGFEISQRMMIAMGVSGMWIIRMVMRCLDPHPVVKAADATPATAEPTAAGKKVD